MVNIVDLIVGLFASYGRTANEEQIRSYCAVLKTIKPVFVQQAIAQAASGSSERLPSAAQLVRMAEAIAKNHNDQSLVNSNRWHQLAADYYRAANKERWTLPMKDELMRICNKSFDFDSGRWTCTEEALRQEVARLVYAVDEFRKKQLSATNDGRPAPDELAERWGWALPRDGTIDWDPSKESLLEHRKKHYR